MIKDKISDDDLSCFYMIIDSSPNMVQLVNMTKKDFVNINFYNTKRTIWKKKDDYKILRYDPNTELFLYYTDNKIFDYDYKIYNKNFFCNLNYNGLTKYTNSYSEYYIDNKYFRKVPYNILTFKVNRKMFNDNDIFKNSEDLDKVLQLLDYQDWMCEKSYLEFVKPEQENFEYYLVGFRYFGLTINDLKFLNEYCNKINLDINCKMMNTCYSYPYKGNNFIIWLLVPKQVYETTNIVVCKEDIVVPNPELLKV
jgi:hypothetical protein